MRELAEQPTPAAAQRVRTEHHHILIVGGGTGGITVAARHRRSIGGNGLAVVDPSEKHYYQPLWTLVGGGVVDKRVTLRAEQGLTPKDAKWVQDAVATFQPEDNCVVTAGGRRLSYDFLVVAPGIQLDWDA